MKVLPILVVLLVLVGGGFYAYKTGLIKLPANSESLQASAGQQATQAVSNIDSTLAQQIHNWRENGWQPPEVLGSISSDIQNASLSATVTTTPQDIWESFRKQGAQAALGQVVESAEVSVNTVSQNVVNEARYQYCLGVVEARQQ